MEFFGILINYFSKKIAIPIALAGLLILLTKSVLPPNTQNLFFPFLGMWLGGIIYIASVFSYLQLTPEQPAVIKWALQTYDRAVINFTRSPINGDLQPNFAQANGDSRIELVDTPITPGTSNSLPNFALPVFNSSGSAITRVVSSSINGNLPPLIDNQGGQAIFDRVLIQTIGPNFEFPKIDEVGNENSNDKLKKEALIFYNDMLDFQQSYNDTYNAIFETARNEVRNQMLSATRDEFIKIFNSKYQPKAYWLAYNLNLKTGPNRRAPNPGEATTGEEISLRAGADLIRYGRVSGGGDAFLGAGKLIVMWSDKLP